MIKKGNRRITITLNQEHNKKFEKIKEYLKVKNNAKAFRKMLDKFIDDIN